jgi:ribosomal protein S27AE
MNQQTHRDCEICEEMAICALHKNMWICNKCWVNEQKAKVEAFNFAQAQANAPVIAPASHISPLPINSVLKEASVIDSNIQVRTDIFNAKTKAINEIKAAIDADDTITNKPYALAEFLKNRFVGLKQVIFEHNQVIVDAGNEQKAIQVYMNQLANTLRKEEREKLKIQDINYNPTPAKISKPKSVSTSGTKKIKFDKVALRKAAATLGVSEFTLQMVAVQKGCSIDEAVAQLKKSIETAKNG